MKKIYIMGISLIMLIISISAVNAGFFDFSGQPDEKIIRVTCDDSGMSGKLKITEYKNYKNFGDYEGGGENVLLIKNGTAEYKLHDNTNFFKTEYYVYGIKLSKNAGDSPNILVEYKLNNNTILTSSSSVENSTSRISFGGDVYSIDGDKVH